MIPRDHVASLERVTKNQVSALRSYQNSTPVKGSWESCRRLERSAFLLQEERICRRGVLFQRGRFCWGEGRYFFGGWYHFQKGWLVGIERDIRALREESLAWEKKELKHLEDESRVTRKKRKSEKAVPGTFDVVFFYHFHSWLCFLWSSIFFSMVISAFLGIGWLFEHLMMYYFSLTLFIWIWLTPMMEFCWCFHLDICYDLSCCTTGWGTLDFNMKGDPTMALLTLSIGF